MGIAQCLLGREERMERKVLVRLVDDEEYLGVLLQQLAEPRLLHHLPCRIIGIAQPKQLHLLLESVATTGVGQLIKR